MRKLLRWIGIGVGGLVGLCVVAYALVYALSERTLRRAYDVPAIALTIPTDQDSIREGRRLATLRGCFHGCHGNEAEGRVMFDQPAIARIVAPNLTAAVRRYSDAQIAIIVRNGVRADGRSLIVMPAEAFAGMTDADLGRIIAFLKSLPPVPGPDPNVFVGPLGRIGLVAGKFKTVAQLVADTVPPPAATNQEAESGRYLARTICAQCHGTDLRGAANPEFTSPDLRVVASYSSEAFRRLLRTGAAVDERDVGEMSVWARNNLSHLTEPEIAALYTYLHAMPEAARN
jgi:mono/diheme cytochrome c family protein